MTGHELIVHALVALGRGELDLVRTYLEELHEQEARLSAGWVCLCDIPSIPAPADEETAA